jgi:hypothetical protein
MRKSACACLIFSFVFCLLSGLVSIRCANAVVPSAPGDINGDGKIDDADFLLMEQAYGGKIGSQNWNTWADINNDGIVNLLDLVIFGFQYEESLHPSPQWQVLEGVMLYIQNNHNDDTVPWMVNLHWTWRTEMSVGYTTIYYISRDFSYHHISEWNVTMQYPNTLPLNYTIMMNFTCTFLTCGNWHAVSWLGTSQNGIFQETYYHFDPYPPTC